MSDCRRQMSRRAMSAAMGVMRLIMLRLIAATGIVLLMMLPVIAATSIVRLTLLPSIVVTNILGLIMLPIIEAIVMGRTLLRSIIEATTTGGRGARLRSTSCQNIQHRRFQLRLPTRHRNVRRPNTRLMKKRVPNRRGRSATRSRRTGRVDTSAVGGTDRPRSCWPAKARAVPGSRLIDTPGGRT